MRATDIDLKTRLAIEEIPLLCIDAVTRNDPEQYADCFKEHDSFWDASALAPGSETATGFPFEGRAAIKQAFMGFQEQLDFALQTHYSTHFIQFDERSARVRYYIGEYGRAHGQSVEFGVGMYRDVYDLCDDGVWRIRSHILTPVFYGTPDLNEIRILTKLLPND